MWKQEREKVSNENAHPAALPTSRQPGGHWASLVCISLSIPQAPCRPLYLQLLLIPSNPPHSSENESGLQHADLIKGVLGTCRAQVLSLVCPGCYFQHPCPATLPHSRGSPLLFEHTTLRCPSALLPLTGLPCTLVPTSVLLSSGTLPNPLLAFLRLHQLLLHLHSPLTCCLCPQ